MVDRIWAEDEFYEDGVTPTKVEISAALAAKGHRPDLANCSAQEENFLLHQLTTDVAALNTLKPDVQIFLTPGDATWTKPANAKTVHILVQDAGFPGADTAAGVYGGAGGGPAGARREIIVPASFLGGTEDVHVQEFGGIGAHSSFGNTGAFSAFQVIPGYVSSTSATNGGAGLTAGIGGTVIGDGCASSGGNGGIGVAMGTGSVGAQGGQGHGARGGAGGTTAAIAIGGGGSGGHGYGAGGGGAGGDCSTAGGGIGGGGGGGGAGGIGSALLAQAGHDGPGSGGAGAQGIVIVTTWCSYK